MQFESSEQDAQNELKRLFIMDAVAEKLDVEVDENEVNGRIAMMAVQSGRRPEKMRDEMIRDGQIDQLFIQIREEKAIEKLLESATVNEISEEEWEAKKGGDAVAEKPKKKTTKKKSSKKKTTKKKAAAKKDDASDDK